MPFCRPDMRLPNRPLAVLSALLLLLAGLVPASAAAFCGPEAACGPCGHSQADARIVAACCGCCDLAAPESAAPGVAERAAEGDTATQGLHAAASPTQPTVAETGTGSAFHARLHRTPVGGPPLFRLYQSLLI